MTKIHANSVNHQFHAPTTRETPKDKIQPQPAPVLHNTRSNQSVSVNPAIKSGFEAGFIKMRLARLLSSKAERGSGDAVKVIHIPADKRHKGLSPYDNLLHFAHRQKGFPDRYRAVNPRLEPAARLAARHAKDKAARKAALEAALRFPLKENNTKLYDGSGNERKGVITAKDVKLNYAQVKIINGKKHYYAFATQIDPDNNPKTHNSIGASGWIRASAIKTGHDPKFNSADVRRSQPPVISESHGKHKNYQQYEVLAQKPEQILNEKTGKPRYGYMKDGEYISYKVLPEVPLSGKASIAASDYLMRKGGVINLGFNVAGVSNDTFNVVNGNKPLVFHRAPQSLKGTTAEIDLYHPKDKNHAGKKPVASMRFVYGYVEYPGADGKLAKRWGWMARAALKPKPSA